MKLILAAPKKQEAQHFLYREAPWLVRRQRERGQNMGKSLYCGFHRKE